MCFVPFLETTAARARYHHNVGQVYNMVIRDLRERVSVCVKREGGKKRETDGQTFVFPERGDSSVPPHPHVHVCASECLDKVSLLCPCFPP